VAGVVSGLEFETALGASTRDTITLLGQDLAKDVMGEVGFGELAFWLATQRRPTRGQTRVFEAVLAALADHGFTPTAIVTRLTWLSAPDSVQGALAAGLLGGGSRFLGVTEDTGRFLHAALPAELPGDDDAGWNALALEIVRAQRAAGKFVPGLGHPVHKDGDPRTPRLMQIAEEEGCLGPHLQLLLQLVHDSLVERALLLRGRDVEEDQLNEDAVLGPVDAEIVGIEEEILRLVFTDGLEPILGYAKAFDHPVVHDIGDGTAIFR